MKLRTVILIIFFTPHLLWGDYTFRVTCRGTWDESAVEVTEELFLSPETHCFLALITNPPSLKGTAFLKKGEECFLFLPEEKQTLELPPFSEKFPYPLFGFPAFYYFYYPPEIPGDAFHVPGAYVELVDRGQMPFWATSWKITLPGGESYNFILTDGASTVLPDYLFTRAFMEYLNETRPTGAENQP